MLSEQELTEAIRAGDKRAFGKFYKGYYNRLIVHVLFLTGSEEVAKDIVQEAFTRVWEKRAVLNTDLSLKGLVRQIAKNLVYDHCRKVKVAQNYEKQFMEVAHDETTLQLEYKELERVLSQALVLLSPEKQEIFRQSRFENKTYSEIAISLKTTPKAVERHMSRTLSFIKEYLSKHSSEAISLLFCCVLLK